jgi:hypothetical protein
MRTRQRMRFAPPGLFQRVSYHAERRCEHVRPCGISLNLQACFWHNGLQHLKAASEERSEYYGPQRTALRFLS